MRVPTTLCISLFFISYLCWEYSLSLQILSVSHTVWYRSTSAVSFLTCYWITNVTPICQFVWLTIFKFALQIVLQNTFCPNTISVLTLVNIAFDTTLLLNLGFSATLIIRFDLCIYKHMFWSPCICVQQTLCAKCLSVKRNRSYFLLFYTKCIKLHDWTFLLCFVVVILYLM